MADFQEVMRQRNRMCKKYYGHCGDCLLNAFATCASPKDDVLPAYEAVILGWARANPEPDYPSWADWQKKMFPMAQTMVCPNQFMTAKEAKCYGQPCNECVKQPIPAEIAAKLGIKPKESEE